MGNVILFSHLSSSYSWPLVVSEFVSLLLRDEWGTVPLACRYLGLEARATYRWP